jgi:hypothetical protein
LTAFDAKDPSERREAVGKTLALSLDRLDTSDQARLCELAVFPEDVQVPIGTVELLWHETAGLDDIDTDDLLQRLFGLSLLLQLDLHRRFLQLHDVIRGWLRDRVAGNLADVERALVNGFKAACHGAWHRIEDSYALSHLPMHLRAVDRDAWHQLLLDPRWMARKLAAQGSGIAALVDDYSGTNGDLRLVGDALRLSAHVLGRDSLQLAGQLFGRLGGSELRSHRVLVREARATVMGVALLPRSSSLAAPGGPLLRTFEGHRGTVSGVVLLPKRHHALSCSYDKTLKLWDLESGALVRTLEGHGNVVDALAVLPDGHRALSSSSDNTIKLWDLGLAPLYVVLRAMVKRSPP